MSDRLKELQRQRALIQEHLAWLDREIAASGSPVSPVTTTVPPHPIPAPISRPATRPPIRSRPVTNPAVAADAEALIAKYGESAQPVESQVKRGCFIYFAIALVLLAAGVLALYFHTTRK